MQFGFGQLFESLASMIIMIVVGVVARATGILKEREAKALSSLIVNITTPALILASMSFSTDKAVRWNVGIMVMVSTIIVGFSCLASQVLHMNKRGVAEAKIISQFCAIFGNISFVGFPICYGLFGSIGLLYAAVYSAAHDVFFWSYGVRLMAGSEKGSTWRNLININMIAIVMGLIFVFMGFKLPEVILKPIAAVGNATVPLALMVVGVTFYKLHITMKDLKEAAPSSLIKLIAVPLFLLIALGLVNIEPVLKQVALVLTAVPCATYTVVLAQNYGRDDAKASRIVLIMTAASMITLPLVILTAKVFWQF